VNNCRIENVPEMIPARFQAASLHCHRETWLGSPLWLQKPVKWILESVAYPSQALHRVTVLTVCWKILAEWWGVGNLGEAKRVRNVQYSAKVGGEKRRTGELEGRKGKRRKDKKQKVIVKAWVMVDEEVDTDCRRQHTLSLAQQHANHKKDWSTEDDEVT